MGKSGKIRVPDTITIILIVICLGIICTWIIPGGEFATPEGQALQLADYVRTENRPVLPWELPMLLIKSISSSLSILVLMGMGSALVAACNTDQTFEVILDMIRRKFCGKEIHVIIFMTFLFSVFGLVVPPQCFIGFTGTVVALSISLGYDAITGVAAVMLGCACSVMAGPLNTITAIAQELAGLPIYSGAWVRVLVYMVLLVITTVYIVCYAEKIRKNPEQSYMRGQETAAAPEELRQIRHVRPLDWCRLFLLCATFFIVAVGSSLWGWTTDHISAAMLCGAVIIGLVSGHSLQKTAKIVEKGFSDMGMMMLIIILANSIGIIMKQGNILGTVVFWLGQFLSAMPSFLVPAVVLLIVTLLNFLIPSGGTKAVMMLPVLVPVTQLAGMSAQNCVLGYTLGDGFSNYILPHASGTIGYLAAANVDYAIWMKFMMNLFLLWMAAGAIILTILYYVGYGPF